MMLLHGDLSYALFSWGVGGANWPITVYFHSIYKLYQISSRTETFHRKILEAVKSGKLVHSMFQ